MTAAASISSLPSNELVSPTTAIDDQDVAPISMDVEYQQVIVCVAALNVRDKPMGAVLETVYAGELFTVYEVVQGWGRVGLNRWVNLDYVCPAFGS